MKIYVDALFRAEAQGRAAFVVGARNDHQWCHMWSSDVSALHAFAARLGLQRSWFQDDARFPHYDLTPGKRLQALKMGAVEKDIREWIKENSEGVAEAAEGSSKFKVQSSKSEERQGMLF